MTNKKRTHKGTIKVPFLIVLNSPRSAPAAPRRMLRTAHALVCIFPKVGENPFAHCSSARLRPQNSVFCEMRAGGAHFSLAPQNTKFCAMPRVFLAV